MNRARFEVPRDLAEGILARTSGPPCEQARARLGDLADDGAGVAAVERRGLLASWLGAKRSREATTGGAGRVERRLVEAHLRHCPDCAALAAAAARLVRDLPALAAPAPPPEFADAVLARTRRRPAGLRGAAARTAGGSVGRRAETRGGGPRADPRTGARRRWQEAVGRLWTRPADVTAALSGVEAVGRLWTRPRIAWEAGCVAALAIWLVCGASWSPLRTTAVEARVLLQQGVSGAGRAGAESAAAVNRTVAAVSERTVRAATSAAAVNRTVAAVSGRTVRAATQGVQDGAGRFARGWRRRAAAAAPQLDRHWRQLVQALEDRDLFDGVAALRSLSRDAGALLAELFSPSSSDTEDAGPRPAARSRP